MKKILTLLMVLLFTVSCKSVAQDKRNSEESINNQGHLKVTNWNKFIVSKDDNWFGTNQAKVVAENVLLYQRDFGGWQKNTQMQLPLSDKEKKKLFGLKSDPQECTIDNGATVQEMLFLSKIYKQQPDEKYKDAFLKGLMYLITSQYANGGLPQFFPLRKGYYTHITYNDDAMVNVLRLFKEVKNNSGYYSITPSPEITKMVANGFDKGIDCILKTQYKQNGVLTSWCAQHDENTLLPADARAFELASLSGKESAQITLLLMSIENPSKEVIDAVNTSVLWFEKTKISLDNYFQLQRRMLKYFQQPRATFWVFFET